MRNFESYNDLLNPDIHDLQQVYTKLSGIEGNSRLPQLQNCFQKQTQMIFDPRPRAKEAYLLRGFLFLQLKSLVVNKVKKKKNRVYLTQMYVCIHNNTFLLLLNTACFTVCRVQQGFSLSIHNCQCLYTYRQSYGRYRVLALQLPIPKSLSFLAVFFKRDLSSSPQSQLQYVPVLSAKL